MSRPNTPPTRHRHRWTAALAGTVAAALLAAVTGLIAAGHPAAAESASPGATQRLPAVQYAEQRYSGPDKTAGGASTNAVAFSHRHSWGARNGEQVLRLTGMPVSNGGNVIVTVSEGTADNTVIGGRIGLEFVGLAKVTLNNVSVEDGAVTIWVTINWGSPIFIYAHYAVP
jgi:hypothetical protein